VLSSKDLISSSSSFKIYDAVLTSSELQVDADPEMEKFQSLLQDYLKVTESSPIVPTIRESHSGINMLTSRITPSSSEDYVYDVFYQRPSTISEWAEAANVGTVTGLPMNVDDSFDYDSDSEVEDDEDVDSNAEDFYKNEYPDEEQSEDGSNAGSSDMFHESSEDEADNEEPRFVPDE